MRAPFRSSSERGCHRHRIARRRRRRGGRVWAVAFVVSVVWTIFASPCLQNTTAHGRTRLFFLHLFLPLPSRLLFLCAEQVVYKSSTAHTLIPHHTHTYKHTQHKQTHNYTQKLHSPPSPPRVTGAYSSLSSSRESLGPARHCVAPVALVAPFRRSIA